jgi:hypothetical protein
MVETEKEGAKVKPAKAPFDESKLTPPQREALAAARAQGVEPIRVIKSMKLDVEPELLDKLIEDVEESRAAERRRSPKDPFKS